jgi:hypothetical protein
MTLQRRASQTLHLSPIRLRFLTRFLFISSASNSWTGLSGLLPSPTQAPRELKLAGIFLGITGFLPLQV